MNDSKAKQVHAAQQSQKGSQTASVAVTPTHKEIARRAFEIYIENGRRQGQSEQYWLQAEQELKNRTDQELKNQKHWRQAEEK
jgi:Protein of unknown function (DUF2934)